MSEEEINAEALRVTDSAANAADYQAEVTVYGENPKVAEAKKLIDEATEFMNKGIRKEITVQQANAKINPLMEKFEKINAQLSSTEQEHLKNYRIEQAQKSIDLQVQQSN